MYPGPVGMLPVTGANVLALGLAGSGLLVGGLIFFRAASFARARKDDRSPK